MLMTIVEYNGLTSINMWDLGTFRMGGDNGPAWGMTSEKDQSYVATWILYGERFDKLENPEVIVRIGTDGDFYSPWNCPIIHLGYSCELTSYAPTTPEVEAIRDKMLSAIRSGVKEAVKNTTSPPAVDNLKAAFRSRQEEIYGEEDEKKLKLTIESAKPAQGEDTMRVRICDQEGHYPVMPKVPASQMGNVEELAKYHDKIHVWMYGKPIFKTEKKGKAIWYYFFSINTLSIREEGKHPIHRSLPDVE